MPKTWQGWQQHQQELMIGFVRAGDREADNQVPALRSQRAWNWGHKPQPGKTAPTGAAGITGVQCPAQVGCSKNICWMKIQRKRSHGMQNCFHLHWLTRSLTHSVNVSWALIVCWQSPKHLRRDVKESASRALSRGAHLIPFHSFWGFSTLGRFITFSGDGWQTCAQ